MDGDVITLDTDWAPDITIDYTADLLAAAGVKATWFITHDSPATRRLLDSEWFDIGLHPNFSPSTTQGANPEAVIKHLKAVAPNAKLARAHSLALSFRHLELMSRFGLESDHSIYLPRASGIQPVLHVCKGGNAPLVRVPYFWEDDYEIMRPDWPWLPQADHQGLRVYDFHPIHIYLNTRHIARYETLKTHGPLQAMDESALKPHRQEGHGIRTVFEKVIGKLPQIWRMTRVVEYWRRQATEALG